MPGNLPHPVSGFVGRADARRQLGTALALARLVTISGPGGFGKSRLALEVAHHRSPAPPGGSWLVGLARVTDPTMIATVVGQAVDAEDDPSTVDAICRRLDGMPLAVELAAALRRTFGPSEILARLGEPLDLLAATGTSTRSRHATLTAAIGWSDRLLSPATQRAFRRFGVFAGPFTAEHAGEVAGLPRREVDVALAELTASSLLAAAVAPTRYRMLDTVRDHAIRELTASGLLDTARSAHCRSYLALAERAEPALTGPEQVTWLDRLQGEQAETTTQPVLATSPVVEIVSPAPVDIPGLPPGQQHPREIGRTRWGPAVLVAHRAVVAAEIDTPSI